MNQANSFKLASPQERADAAKDRAAVFKAPMRDWQMAHALVDAVARRPVGPVAAQVVRSVDSMNGARYAP